MKTLLLILALSLSTFTQKLPREITRTYDRFNDETTVTLALRINDIGKKEWFISESWLGFEAEFRHRGTTPAAVDRFTLRIIDSCRTYYCFAGDADLIFLVDGWRMSLPPIRVIGRTDVASFPVTREELEKLASAKKLEARLDATEMAWKPKQISLIKTLLDLTVK